MMGRAGQPRQMLVLAASLLLWGVTGCVYGPYGSYLDPYCGGACHDGACPPSSGNSWYDPLGLPATGSTTPFGHGPYNNTYGDAGGGGYACNGCGAADSCAPVPLAQQPLGPSQSRFHPVPVRPVFSEYTPAIYAAPVPGGGFYPPGEIALPGEATAPAYDSNYQPLSVHGAFISGVKVAEDVHKYLDLAANADQFRNYYQQRYAPAIQALTAPTTRHAEATSTINITLSAEEIRRLQVYAHHYTRNDLNLAAEDLVRFSIRTWMDLPEPDHE